MSTFRASLLRIVVASTVLVIAYSALLCVPRPRFPFSVRADSLVLHSDRPLSSAAATHVLELATAKLASSPLYSGRRDYNIFICNSRWRQVLFFNKDYGVAGVALYPVTANVFLRDASFEDNRLILAELPFLETAR
jgi:hypothetical protein